jgi:hypothetical protein
LEAMQDEMLEAMIAAEATMDNSADDDDGGTP